MTAAARLALALSAALTLAPSPGRPASRSEDPDWPCPQRLVPSITAAAVWHGPELDATGDWRAEPRVAALVDHIAPRRVPANEGEAAIKVFLDESAAGERERLVTLAVAGLLEETNRARTDLIDRIKQFTRRQRDISEIVARITAELRALPPDAQGEEAERRAELEQRRTFTSRAFQEAQRTVRFACEAPLQLEARLGTYMRALQDGLS
jgi:hypothetical protein